MSDDLESRAQHFIIHKDAAFESASQMMASFAREVLADVTESREQCLAAANEWCVKAEAAEKDNATLRAQLEAVTREQKDDENKHLQGESDLRHLKADMEGVRENWRKTTARAEKAELERMDQVGLALGWRERAEKAERERDNVGRLTAEYVVRMDKALAAMTAERTDFGRLYAQAKAELAALVAEVGRDMTETEKALRMAVEFYIAHWNCDYETRVNHGCYKGHDGKAYHPIEWLKRAISPARPGPEAKPVVKGSIVPEWTLYCADEHEPVASLGEFCPVCHKDALGNAKAKALRGGSK